VFTARYGLIAYIKQIMFRLLKVKIVKSSNNRSLLFLFQSTNVQNFITTVSLYIMFTPYMFQHLCVILKEFQKFVPRESRILIYIRDLVG